MKRAVLLLVPALALALGALPAAAESPGKAPLHRAAGEAVEGSYIVVMKPGKAAEQAADRAGVRPNHVYEHVLNGFSARMNDRQLDAIRRNPNVDYVEEDQVATTVERRTRRPRRPEGGSDDVSTMATQWNPTWGLDRIDQRYRPLSGSYTYNTKAPGVDVYIVDTGIQTNHWEFNGKAMRGYDAFGGNSEDCNGHGTHVAGTVAGETYGVAKDAWLWSVRVLSCSGSGSYSGIIAGTDWVRNNAAAWPGYPAVANYSLGGGYSSALNNAVNNLANSGVFVAVASGNSSANACSFSPASASQVFSTNASDSADRRASFSNHGGCTHAYAPGVSVTSAWVGGGTRTISGTSMASPHVAGIGALYKATYGNAASTTVRSWIINTATSGVISGNPSGTPNRLVYKANL